MRWPHWNQRLLTEIPVAVESLSNGVREANVMRAGLSNQVPVGTVQRAIVTSLFM
jgi:hypothetical protein